MDSANKTAAELGIDFDGRCPADTSILSQLSRAELERGTIHLWRRVDRLEDRVTAIEAMLAKSSANSSKPPSTDNPFRKPAPAPKLGTAPKRTVGGQVGHRGVTLLRKDPDVIVPHPLPARCLCGESLTPEPACARQVLDLPTIHLQVIEHRTFKAVCRCGRRHQSKFPGSVTAPVQYGPQLQALGAYLSQHHMLPVARTAQILSDLVGEPISPATIQNAITSAATALNSSVELIKQAVIAAPVVHADETGLRVEGSLSWMHVAVTEALTLAAVHEKRGAVGMQDLGVLEQIRGIVVHDGLGAYWDLFCQHALCNAHHLRELVFEAEQTGQLWSKDLIELLLKANARVRATGAALPAAEFVELQVRYRALLDEGEALNPPNRPGGGNHRKPKQSTATNLLRRLRAYEDETLRFAEDARVPFTNNLAERSIRMPKVKQKTSGCFRTAAGARAFCVIRSYFATLAKQKRDLLGSLVMALQGNAPDPRPA